MYINFTNDPYILNRQDKFDIVNAAAYSGDVTFLRKLYQDYNFYSDLPGIKHYINGFIHFTNKSENWQKLFFQCGQDYQLKPLASPTLLPRYVVESSNFFSVNDYKSHLEAINFVDSQESKHLDCANNVLVSCDKDYFLIYSDYFLKQFRLHNDNKVIFIIVLDDNSNLFKIQKKFKALNKLHQNLEIDFLYTKYNVALLASLARFLKCEEIMERFACNIVILDIDMNVDINITQFSQSMKHNIAVSQIHETCVPWVRLNAGLCIFKHNHESINFLRIYSTYVEYALYNGGNWTLDQAALLITKEHYGKIFGHIVIDDLTFKLSLRMSSRIPKQITSKRALAKSQKLPTLALGSLVQASPRIKILDINNSS